MFPFFIPIKAKWLVMIMIGLGLLAAWRGPGDGIAHFTHLGGAAIAYVYLKQDWRMPSFFQTFRRNRRRRKAEKKLQRNRQEAEIMDEVDKILDRINEVGGYDNLTEREKKVLENAAKKLSEKRD